MHDLNPLARTRPVSVIVIIRSAPDSSISANAAWKVARVPARPFSNLAFRWIVSKIFAISHVRAVRGWPGHAAAHTWSYNVHSPPRGSPPASCPVTLSSTGVMLVLSFYRLNFYQSPKLWWYCSCVDNSRVVLHTTSTSPGVGVDIGPDCCWGTFRGSGFLNCGMHTGSHLSEELQHYCRFRIIPRIKSV